MRPENPKYPELQELHVGKSGRGWLIPADVPNRADYIHCTDSADWNKIGQGYAGSTLKFTLVDSSYDGEFELRGGWHSNDKSLLNDTGIDLSQEHYTHIDTVVEYADGNKREVTFDIEGWHLGDFDREEDVQWVKENIIEGLDFVDSMRITNYSMGGSSSWTISKETLTQIH